MITIVEIIYNFVISTLVGLFGIHLILRKGLVASKLLGLYFLIFCSRIILAYFVTGGRIIEYPHLFLLGSPIHFLASPVACLFVYYMLYPLQKFRLWHGILFLPFVLHTLELLPFYFGPVENKLHEINLVLTYKSLVNYPGSVTFFSQSILSTLKVGFTSFYALISFWLVINYLRSNRAKYQSNRFLFNWLLLYTSLNLLSVVFVVAYVMGIIGFNNLRFSYADLLMHLAAFVNLGFVLYRPALLDGLAFQSLVSRLQVQDRQLEANEGPEKLEKYEGYAHRLEEFFSISQPFLQDDLTVELTAKGIGVSARELTRTIQYMYQLSYPDFVNSWRINYIVEQRKLEEHWKNYSQDLLAEHAGFGSRQGLHNAVNRLHGMTPSAFFAIKDQQV